MNSRVSNSNDLSKSSGFSFDMNPEDFDKRLAAELQSMNAMSTFQTLGNINSAPTKKPSVHQGSYQPSPPAETVYFPSSSSVVGKIVPAGTMLPSKFLRHDDNFKRIHTAKTVATNVSDPDFDPDEIDKQLNDPASDANYNSSGNNVFVLSCNAVTSMPVVPREGADGKKLSTPQLKKQVTERYAEVQSLFAPPTTLTQHDVDILNITMEAKKYEEFYEASVVDPMEHINLSHEISLQKHVDRLKKPRGYVPFGASSPLPHYSKSAPTSLSPIRGKMGKKRRNYTADPFSDTESMGSSYTSPVNQLKTMHIKSKSPRSPILTVDAFTEVADKMKEDIRELVQDTIRSELMNMRKKQSRGGNVYIEPTTPGNDEGGSAGGRRQQQQPLHGSPRSMQQPSGRTAATPDTLEQVIERKIEGKLQQLSEELLRLKNKPNESISPKAAAASNKHSVGGVVMSPVKPPVGNGYSPKPAAPNRGRKLKDESANSGNSNGGGQQTLGKARGLESGTGSAGVTFSDQPENIPTFSDMPKSQPARRLSGASVTFSSDSPTPIMSAQPPYSSGYNRNFSITPGGSLIHSFIDENREYAEPAEFTAAGGGGGGYRRRSSGSKDFISVSTPAGPNIFGTTPAANAARLSSPMFSSEVMPPPHSPAAAALDGRASSPRAVSRQALQSASDKGNSPSVSAPVSNSSSYGNRSRPISQAAPVDHIDAHASEVTIQVVSRDNSPSERRKSTEVNPNIKVKIEPGVVLEESNSGGGRRKKSSGVVGSSSPKAAASDRKSSKALSGSGSIDSSPLKDAPTPAAATVTAVSNRGVGGSTKQLVESGKNDIELMLMQKLNEVLMAPLPADVVQPPVVARSSKRLSVGTVQRQSQSRDLVSSALLVGTASAASALTPVASVKTEPPPVVATATTTGGAAAAVVAATSDGIKEASTTATAASASEVHVENRRKSSKEKANKSRVNSVDDSTAAATTSTSPSQPVVVVVQKPIIADTKNSTVAAIINGRPIPTEEVILPVKSDPPPEAVRESVAAALPTSTAVQVPTPATSAVAAPSSAPIGMASASGKQPSIESIAMVRDAIKSAAGLGSRIKTSEIMAQYDQEQKKEEEALLYGTGYGNDAIIAILKKFEKNDGVEVEIDQKLSEREAEVLDSEYNELTKQIAQLTKIKSKIKKDLKTWVSDFETKEGRPPSTADKLTIEDRFLAYKTVVTEVEEAKRYSNKISDLLKASR